MELHKHTVVIADNGDANQIQLTERFQRLGGFSVKTCLIDEIGHVDAGGLPDVLLLVLGDTGAEQELDVLERLSPSMQDTPILVIGPGDNTQLMRKAMRLGVQDYLVKPVDCDECVVAVKTLVQRKEAAKTASSKSELIAFINAKGGSGASLLACNTAHIMAAVMNLPVVLVDLDLQFGSLSVDLDLAPEHHLLEVINIVDELDPVAISAYLTKHASGIDALVSRSDEVILPGEVSPQRLDRLIRLLRAAYPHVVVDLPRLVDPLTTLVLENADRIVVVMQQSLAHVRDVKRLLRIMTTELGIQPGRISVVVNRYDPKSDVSLHDLEKVLPKVSLETICNDYLHVTKAADLGKPLHEYAANAPITGELSALTCRLTGCAPVQKKGFWANLFSS